MGKGIPAHPLHPPEPVGTTTPSHDLTKYGIVRVVWKDVAGNRCWFSSGTGDAKQEAVPAIEHVE